MSKGLELKFYSTHAWKVARNIRINKDNYLCQYCLEKGTLVIATYVHHIKHLKTHPHLALDMDNLISLCKDCHDIEHPKRTMKAQAKSRKARIIKG